MNHYRFTNDVQYNSNKKNKTYAIACIMYREGCFLICIKWNDCM